MRLPLVLCILTCLTSSTLAQVEKVDTITLIKRGRINGAIFNASYKMPYNDGIIERFSPTKNEAIIADKEIRQRIKELNKSKPNQVGPCPIIHKRYFSYFRQYVGVINEKGEKVIHIQFLWNRYSIFERMMGVYDDRGEYNYNYLFINDGCSRYWQVNMNLKTMEPFGFSVNGIG